MRWVVDASATVAYLLGEGTDDERAAMLGDGHAPGLVDVEVTQTLRGLVRGGKISVELAEDARRDLVSLGVDRHSDWSLLGRAWELRDRCTVYDGLYVALTEALGATFVTRDAPLARSVASLVAVRLSG